MPEVLKNEKVISEEIENALKKIKSGKAVEPDEISTDMYKVLGRPGVI